MKIGFTFWGSWTIPQWSSRQADAALMCSRKEACGRVTMEAMLPGTPVVGTDSGGTAELIRNGVDGFLYAPSDDAMLAEKLAWFIEHPEEASQLGEAARESMTARLAADPYDERVLEVCRRLAGEPPAESAAMAALVESWRRRGPPLSSGSWMPLRLSPTIGPLGHGIWSRRSSARSAGTQRSSPRRGGLRPSWRRD